MSSYVMYQFTDEGKLYGYRIFRGLSLNEAKAEALAYKAPDLETFLVKNDIRWRDQCQELYTPVGNTMENRVIFRLDLSEANLLD